MIFGAKKRGFTLVEMLIVIVIIGVLAAALIPRLTSVRGRANDVARKADIQQLATAIITYQMDNNGALPKGPVGLSGEFSTLGITGALITAGMDGLPIDPVPSTKFNFNDTLLPVDMGNYGYLIIGKDGVDDNGFVLMAKTQTAGGSNRVATGALVGFITTGTQTENITTCKTVTKSGVALNNGGNCLFRSISELRYIMVR